jgi:hypothetical protein
MWVGLGIHAMILITRVATLRASKIPAVVAGMLLAELFVY